MTNSIGRSSEMLAKYKLFKETVGENYAENFSFDISEQNVIKKFNYWAIIPNDFPYDKIFELHHLIVPLRKFSDPREMTNDEFRELEEIKYSLGEEGYETMLENTDQGRSVKASFHIHAVIWKRVN